MKIVEMTATFGALEKATLRPGPGLTLIQAPNESGKSTWCAFLRAMLYGFPTRDRDKAGYLAEKNRYQPWSGAAMEGSLTLEWQGREITLRRGPKGSVPWGAFSAVWTASGETVPELTAENCGQVLLGVSREVFERTAFVSQGDIALSPSGDLEKRIAALATSGDEDVSYSQVEERLRAWRNRRKVNSRVGLIPELEGQLAQTDAALERQGTLLRQAQAAQQEREALEVRQGELEAQVKAHAAAERVRQAEKRAQAQEEYDALLAQVRAAEEAAKALPPADELRQAQGDLSYLNTLAANLRMAENAVPEAKEKADAAEQAVSGDPHFAGMDPAQATAKAQGDCDAVKALQKKALSPLSLLGAPVGVVLGLVLSRAQGGQSYSLPILVLGALIGWAIVALPMFLTGNTRKKKAAELLERYNVSTPEEILALSAAYGEKCAAAQEGSREYKAVLAERDKLAAQKEELTAQLLDFVRPFAPEVDSPFGVSAALSRALQQGENARLLRSKLDGAEKLLSSLPAPAAGDVTPVPVPAPQGDPAVLSAQLSAVRGELHRSAETAARLQGELRSLGDPAELEAQHSVLTEELDQRRGEYDALTAALDALAAADSLLRERFSPAVNAKAGEYLSALTGGRYEKAALTRQFQALAQERGEVSPRPDLSLSAGAGQQLYLAFRLAMCDLALPQDESCPIVLDDALDAFDDARAALALGCLLELAQRRQVLLFSCHGREKELLRGKAPCLTL